MKWCSGCKSHKETTEFPKDRIRKDGLNNTCNACFSRYHRINYAKVRVRRLWTMIKSKYGLSMEAFKALLKDQHWKCALCESKFPPWKIIIERSGPKIEMPYVDHNHETGVIRGLLCHWCNSAEGHMTRIKKLDIRRWAENFIKYRGDSTHGV